MIDPWVEFLGESFILEGTSVSMRNRLPIMRSSKSLVALRTRAFRELDVLFDRVVQSKQIHDGLPVLSLLESQEVILLLGPGDLLSLVVQLDVGVLQHAVHLGHLV